jgi:hypothetical protein
MRHAWDGLPMHDPLPDQRLDLAALTDKLIHHSMRRHRLLCAQVVPP